MSILQTAGLSGAARSVPCKVLAPFAGEVPGLVQESPAARATGAQVVMIAGVIAERPNWDGVICVVGPRTVWAHVSAGEVVSFASFVSVDVAEGLQAISEKGFDDGLQATLSRPERLAGELAETDVTPGRAWGALLGAELAAARPYWLGQEVILVGEAPVDGFYERALQSQGAMLQRMESDAAFDAGQAALLAEKGTLS